MHKMIDKVFDVRSFPHTPIWNRIRCQVDGCFGEEVRGKLKNTFRHTLYIELSSITCFSRNNKRWGKKWKRLFCARLSHFNTFFNSFFSHLFVCSVWWLNEWTVYLSENLGQLFFCLILHWWKTTFCLRLTTALSINSFFGRFTILLT